MLEHFPLFLGIISVILLILSGVSLGLLSKASNQCKMTESDVKYIKGIHATCSVIGALFAIYGGYHLFKRKDIGDSNKIVYITILIACGVVITGSVMGAIATTRINIDSTKPACGLTTNEYNTLFAAGVMNCIALGVLIFLFTYIIPTTSGDLLGALKACDLNPLKTADCKNKFLKAMNDSGLSCNPIPKAP